MGRTRKLRVGGQTKRKADKPSEESKTSDVKKPKKEDEIEVAKTLTSMASPAIQINSCVDTVHASYMGYHLKADILHDFGRSVERDISEIHGISLPNSVDENEVSKYFLTNFPAIESDLRKKNTVDFTLAEKTSLFPQAGVESLFQPYTGMFNSEIGVLQDAGVKLYKLMNATNLVTFGSILDQASKPIEDAFYFKTDGLSLVFPACVFGFNPNKVKTITISGFNGKAADCKFRYVTGTGEEVEGGSDGTIQLNQQKGDFVSIAKVNERGGGDPKMKGIIGKALGDISLIASLMPNIGDVKNVLCPPPDAALKSTKNGKTQVIKKVLFNTGDRLAHIRAYAFGIPTVFSNKTKEGIRKFNYIPGSDINISAETLEVQYTELSRKIIAVVETAYTDLISHLRSLLVDGSFDTEKSMKSGLKLVPNDSIKQKYTADLLNLLIKNVTKIKEIVVAYCNSKVEGVTPELGYKNLLKEAGNLTPSSTTTLSRNGRDILLILNVLKPLTDLPEIPKGTYTFYVSEVYQAIGKGVRLAGKFAKIFTMFGDGMPEINSSTSVSGGDKDSFEVFGVTFVPPKPKLLESQPIESEYLKDSYLVDASEMTSAEIVEVYQLHKRHPNSIIDEILLESLYQELTTITDIPEVAETEEIHTDSSFKFNAFACTFNASIAGNDTELGKELLEYASKFKLRYSEPMVSPSTPPRPPRSEGSMFVTPGVTQSTPSQQMIQLPDPATLSSSSQRIESDSDSESGRGRGFRIISIWASEYPSKT